MHVAQFVHRYPPALGGAEAYTARLCNYLSQCGDRVSVWTSNAIQLEEMWQKTRSNTQQFECENNLEPIGTRPPVIKRYRPIAFPARRYVLKALSLLPFRKWQCLLSPCNPVCPNMWRDAINYKGHLDVVHAVAFPYSFPVVCGLELANRRGVPFFVTPFLHLGDPYDPADGTRQRYSKPHLRWLLRQADGIFVQTELERTAVIGLGVEEKRVFLQGLGVDARECTGGDGNGLRSKLAVRSAEVLVGHLANNSVEKGTCDLLEAADRLWRKGEQFRVVLAGPEMKNFSTFWEKYRSKDKVIRLGALSEAGKRDFFAAFDLFALPSRTDSFGLVLLEAWANKKANLVYRAGGPAELVRDGIDGLHAQCGDIGHLSNQLGRLITDEQLRMKLGETGFKRIEREFQWSEKLELVRGVLKCETLPSANSRNSPVHDSQHRTVLKTS